MFTVSGRSCAAHRAGTCIRGRSGHKAGAVAKDAILPACICKVYASWQRLAGKRMRDALACRREMSGKQEKRRIRSATVVILRIRLSGVMTISLG